MFRIIEKFFYDLTRRNWGAPYHFIITAGYFQLVIWFFNIKDINHPVMPFAFAVYLLISMAYSIYQLKNKTDNLRGILEDTAFELAGFFVAVLPISGKGVFQFASLLPIILSRKPRVCIDPGHGGNDPGAVYDIQEKDINFKIAKLIKSKLEKVGIDTIMTRENDETVNLGTRCSISNTKDADFFISIHANASPSPVAKGFQVYYISGIGKEIAQKIFDEIISHVYPEKTKWSYISEAHFYVLKHTWAPAVLVEVGFLSNEEDRVFLMRDNYLDELTDRLVLVIANLFEVEKKKKKEKKG